MSAPGNVLVNTRMLPGADIDSYYDLVLMLMLDFNRCGASMKSILFCTRLFRAYQVADLDGLYGCSVVARVSWWLLAN
ncbi:hypothetical protein DPMN_082277 [Dreissena polymorpha]|uniref:Uncharacterized protein n=1 Tax=Dreissena polymorpha TaxID=45954 RepID=A0A9D4BA00_DREPO|nr:hypothetical protein DPMN_082277 [Dreissena polymorpha]